MHDLGQHMTTSDFWHCILTFRRSSEVTDLGWSHAYPQQLIWRFRGFLEVLWPNTWLISYIDMFLVPLYTNVNRGHWPSLPSGDFADEGDAVPFRDAVRHKYFINTLTVTVLNSAQNWMGKVLCLYDLEVLRYPHVKLKNCRFCKNLTFALW